MKLVARILNLQDKEGEIRGSKPDGRTERERGSILGEIVVGGRNGDKVKTVTSRQSGPLVHLFNDRCSGWL